MELGAMEYLALLIGEHNDAEYYNRKLTELKESINKHCYDEKDGIHYICVR